jgi:hypothetical protein
MIDPGTGLTILGTAIGSAKLAEKILGPTADLAGTGLKEWTEKRVATVRRIFEHAGEIQGEKTIEGGVPPRVLRDVLNEGSLRDDDVSVSYYGGILASSKSGVSRDDRGAYFTGLVDRLTSYQLRGHFILYSIVRSIFKGQPHNLNDGAGRSACQTFVPLAAYLGAMQPEPNESFEALLNHVLFGLQKEKLIEDQFQFGSQADMAKHLPGAPTTGFLFSPSALGVNLFLWAAGQRDMPVNGFLTAEFELPDLGIRIQQGSFAASNPPPPPAVAGDTIPVAPAL